MQYFPVSHSNLSAEHLGLFIASQYALPGKLNCRLIKSGINDTYRISGPNYSYVFRVYSLNWRTITEIEEEIRLLELLRSENIPVSYPLADSNGTYIQSFPAPEGTRYGVLFSDAEGEKLHHYDADTHFQIGRIMARMHQTTLNLRLNRVTYTADVLLKDSLKEISAFLPAGTEEFQFLQSLQHTLLNLLESADTSQIRSGVVHLDIWFDNININHQNQPTIFDFDFCGNGWLCLDLAYYMMQLVFVEKNEPSRSEKLASFFKGYESITRLPESEKKLLQALGLCLYFFYLGNQCRRFGNWSNMFLNDAYLKRYVSQIIKPYSEFHPNSF